MNKAIETCKKNELWGLIKKVSNHLGGDDLEWLKAFAKNMVEIYSINESLACFRDLITQCKAVPTVKRVDPPRIEPPKEIQYRPPFRKE